MRAKAYSKPESPFEFGVGATSFGTADGLTTGISSEPSVGDGTSAMEASVGAAWVIQPHAAQTAIAVAVELRVRILFFSCCAANI